MLSILIADKPPGWQQATPRLCNSPTPDQQPLSPTWQRSSVWTKCKDLQGVAHGVAFSMAFSGAVLTKFLK